MENILLLIWLLNSYNALTLKVRWITIFATHSEYLISFTGLGRGSFLYLQNQIRRERAKNFFGYRAEFDQMKGVRAELVLSRIIDFHEYCR